MSVTMGNEKYNFLVAKIDKLEQEKRELVEALECSINQLRGVSLAVRAHGQNINPAFYILTYENMAKEKEEVLAKIKSEEL